MLADLLSYPHYAPGTLVIKFTMAVAAAYIFEAMRERSGKLAAQLIGGAVVGAIDLHVLHRNILSAKG